MTQEQIIYDAIDRLIEGGIDDLVVIYNTIENRYKIPRPTIRRFARKYRIVLQKKCMILSANLCEIKTK